MACFFFFFTFFFKDSVTVLRHYVIIYKGILYNYRVIIYLDVDQFGT